MNIILQYIKNSGIFLHEKVKLVVEILKSLIVKLMKILGSAKIILDLIPTIHQLIKDKLTKKSDE